MHADRHGDRQRTPGVERSLVVAPHVRGRDEVDAGLAGRAVHEPIRPHVAPVFRVSGHDHGRRDVRPAILDVHQRNGDRGQVDVLAQLDHVLARPRIDQPGLDGAANAVFEANHFAVGGAPLELLHLLEVDRDGLLGIEIGVRETLA